MPQGARYIRSTAADNGWRDSNRNFFCPQEPFWLSPAIRLHDGGGGLGTEAAVGLPSSIVVTATGRTAFTDAIVEAYVCFPTAAGTGPLTALQGTARWVRSYSGAVAANQSVAVELAPDTAAQPPASPPSPLVSGTWSTHVATPANWTPGGAANAAPAWVWRPVQDQFALSGGQTGANARAGHVCIAANVYSETAVQADGAPLTSFVNPCQDSHQAQVNISIVVVSPSGPSGAQKATPVDLPILVAPPREGDGGMRLEVRRVARARIGTLERLLMRREGLVEPDLERRLRPSFFRPLDFALATKGVRGRRLCFAGDHFRPRPVTLRAWLRPEEPPGSVHAFDVVNHDSDGRLVGGVRVLAVVGRPESDEEPERPC